MRITVWTSSNNLYNLLTETQRDILYKTPNYLHGHHDILLQNLWAGNIYIEVWDFATTEDSFEIKQHDSIKIRDHDLKSIYLIGNSQNSEVRILFN